MPTRHPFRDQSEEFDGRTKHQGPLESQAREDILREVEGINFNYGKASNDSQKSVRDEVLDILEDFQGIEDDVEELVNIDVMNNEDTLSKKKGYIF